MGKRDTHHITVESEHGSLHITALTDGQVAGLVGVSPGVHNIVCMRERVADACQKAGGLAKEVNQEIERRLAQRSN